MRSFNPTLSIGQTKGGKYNSTFEALGLKRRICIKVQSSKAEIVRLRKLFARCAIIDFKNATRWTQMLALHN